jgi:riboflavin kinase / FMN adenylyltransferase
MGQLIISGKVIRGDGYGRKLGFPTANLDHRQWQRDHLNIKFGIYAGRATIEPLHKQYQAAIVVGPLDQTGLPKLEAHLLGFKGNLYGKRLNLELVTYIRPFRKYTTEQKLIKQITSDINLVKKLLTLKRKAKNAKRKMTTQN